MQNNIEQYLEQLCNLARELGASNAKAFAAKDVVVDDRVHLKCQVPICAEYGVNLMCPPHVMPISDFVRILAKYQFAVLLQVTSPIPQEMLRLLESDSENLGNLYQNDGFNANYIESLTQVKKKLHEIVNKVEVVAFSIGYRFAAGFVGGSCRLCVECAARSSNEPCRHPFKARPSMEAMGIDVFQTATNAGLPFNIPPKEIAVWNGLVLVD